MLRWNLFARYSSSFVDWMFVPFGNLAAFVVEKYWRWPVRLLSFLSFHRYDSAGNRFLSPFLSRWRRKHDKLRREKRREQNCGYLCRPHHSSPVAPVEIRAPPDTDLRLSAISGRCLSPVFLATRKTDGQTDRDTPRYLFLKRGLTFAWLSSPFLSCFSRPMIRFWKSRKHRKLAPHVNTWNNTGWPRKDWMTRDKNNFYQHVFL